MGLNGFHSGQHRSLPNGSAASGDDCEVLRELLPAYSLGATDPDETRLVESLLEKCPDAASELADYKMLAEKMLFSAPPAKPPTHLKGKLLAAIASEPVLVGGKTSIEKSFTPQPAVSRRWNLRW